MCDFDIGICGTKILQNSDPFFLTMNFNSSICVMMLANKVPLIVLLNMIFRKIVLSGLLSLTT